MAEHALSDTFVMVQVRSLLERLEGASAARSYLDQALATHENFQVVKNAERFRAKLLNYLKVTQAAYGIDTRMVIRFSQATGLLKDEGSVISDESLAALTAILIKDEWKNTLDLMRVVGNGVVGTSGSSNRYGPGCAGFV